MKIKEVLIVPDIEGWATDSMANGIMDTLKGDFNFTKKYNDDILYPQDFEKYDIIYMMIPGYIDESINKKYYPKLRTTFHGGPAVEGQADQIQLKYNPLKLSYVSKEVRDRVKPYGIKNMTWTPHGVNIDKFDSENEVKEIKTFGFAGHARYLMLNDSQHEHRRGHWIIDAWRKLNFDLKIAGGMPRHPKHVNDFNKIYPNIDCQTYSRNDIIEFYRKIDCYLIPDKRAGGPMPALEAGMMNIPLITTDCGLLGDCFIHMKHGILIKSYKQFIESIKWMKNNPDESIQMGKNWGNYVRNNRSWKSVSNKWKEFLT